MIMDVLESTNNGDHRQGCLHTKVFIPSAFGTQFAIVGNAVGIPEPKSAKTMLLLFTCSMTGWKR